MRKNSKITTTLLAAVAATTGLATATPRGRVATPRPRGPARTAPAVPRLFRALSAARAGGPGGPRAPRRRRAAPGGLAQLDRTPAPRRGASWASGLAQAAHWVRIIAAGLCCKGSPKDAQFWGDVRDALGRAAAFA